MFRSNSIKSVTVVRMEVPCCGGLIYLTKEAVKASGKDIPIEEIVIGIKGDIVGEGKTPLIPKIREVAKIWLVLVKVNLKSVARATAFHRLLRHQEIKPGMTTSYGRTIILVTRLTGLLMTSGTSCSLRDLTSQIGFPPVKFSRYFSTEKYIPQKNFVSHYPKTEQTTGSDKSLRAHGFVFRCEFRKEVKSIYLTSV
jgi:hypothetical protein